MTELAFERIHIVQTDPASELLPVKAFRHWQFYLGAMHIADYWPASGRGQVIGTPKSVRCGSTAQAQKLAVAAKRQLTTAIAGAMRAQRC